MDYLPSLFIAGILILAAWLLLRPHAVFSIRIQQGRPSVRHGKVTAAFLNEIEAFCEDHDITSGVIRGIRKGDRIALAFSGGIPKHYHQQLRNLWALPR